MLYPENAWTYCNILQRCWRVLKSADVLSSLNSNWWPSAGHTRSSPYLEVQGGEFADKENHRDLHEVGDQLVCNWSHHKTILKLFGTKVCSTEKHYKAPYNTRENIRKTCRNYDLVDSMNMGIAWDYRNCHHHLHIFPIASQYIVTSCYNVSSTPTWDASSVSYVETCWKVLCFSMFPQTWCDTSAPMCPCPPKLQTQVPKNAKSESWHVMIFNIFVTVLVTVSAAIHWGPRCNAKIRQGCKQRRHPQTCSTHWSKMIQTYQDISGHIYRSQQVTTGHIETYQVRNHAQQRLSWTGRVETTRYQHAQ